MGQPKMSVPAVNVDTMNGWAVPAGLCLYVPSSSRQVFCQWLASGLSATRAKVVAMMTTKTPGALASFIRFVMCGGGVTVMSGFVLVMLEAQMSLLLANAVVTILGTLLANELHSRISFGSDRRGWRMHLESTATAFGAWLVTSAAMLTLHRVSANPAVLAEQAVYISASGVAGLARFLTLRLVVFAKKPESVSNHGEIVLAA